MMVSFCTCERLPFREILRWARDHGASSFEEVKAGMCVGRRCGMCACYIEYALATGSSEVPYPCPPMPEAESVSNTRCI